VHFQSIGVVCRRTGLKSDRLRAWERRYHVVEPVRSEGNQRLYREHDVEKLLLLRRATDAGHRIAQIAHLSVAELTELMEIETSSAPFRPLVRPSPREGAQATSMVAACLAAIQQLDDDGLRAELDRALEALSPAAITQKLLVPLIHDIGNLWAEGGLKVAHEHLGTAVLRGFIEGLRSAKHLPEAAPRLLVTTPSGERHELGALLAMATATDCGWEVTYLGPDLPAQEIAAAARQCGVAAIGVSVVCPIDRQVIVDELHKLRRHLGDGPGIIIGGRLAAELDETASEIGAVLVEDLVGLQPALALFA